MKQAQRSCAAHPDRPSLARCKRCGRALCDACWAFVANESDPWCARCAVGVRNKGASLVARVGVFVLASAVMLGVATVLGWRDGSEGIAVAIGVLGTLVTAGVSWALSVSGGGKDAPPIRERAEDDPIPEGPRAMERAAGAYRARMADLAVRAMPMLSGRVTALTVVGALLLCVVVFPTVLKLPRWVEIELGLGLFWLVLSGLLTGLLYRGFGLREDHALLLPWNQSARGDGKKQRESSGGGGSIGCGDGCNGLSGCDAGDGEGLVVVLVVAVVALVAVGFAWLVVELVAPLLFFLAYEVIVRAIARAGRDRHDCKGALGKSLLWGALWSLAYVLPFSALAWGVHAVLARR